MMNKQMCLCVIFLSLFTCLGIKGAPIIETQRIYLSGLDKDSDVKWDFMCSAGRNNGKWTKIKVPSCWETQGFGSYYYGWEEPEDCDETGYYRHDFEIDKSLKGKSIAIVFEGSMTDTEVKVNGILAGNIHEGGFYRFSYDISRLLHYGKKNRLEVKVKKCPSNKSIYRAERQSDFWLFGGIYRPVYLEVKPNLHIESLAIDAKADGSLSVLPFVSSPGKGKICIHVETMDGKQVSETFSSNSNDTLCTIVNNITPWSNERPVLYRLVAELQEKGKTIHRISETIGFRTVEYRPAEGLFLNGARIIFKGVNRHCFHPESGRTLSREISLSDAKVIKEMNMNAVRMSHYPPDKDFLEICDSIGLLVIDELCAWQKKYDTPTATRLVKSVVERDRNHPSVILWANGNEGGWNTDVDEDYSKYDLSHRLVIHPWERFNGTDTKHYPNYNYVVNSTIYDSDIYFPTEFMHALFDGGAAASLSDFWEVMMKHRAPAGGFIWALLDEGLVRADMNDSIDCRFDLAPDGILGPNREKEGSFYAIKEIWSPVKIIDRILPSNKNLSLCFENNYMFTNLSECRATCYLYNITGDKNGNFNQKEIYQAPVALPSVLPGERKMIAFDLPKNWHEHDMLLVKVTDPNGYEIYERSFSIGNDRMRLRIKDSYTYGEITIEDNNNSIIVTQNGKRYSFNKSTGKLDGVDTPTGHISIQGFPAVVTSDNVFKKLAYYKDGDKHIIEPQFEGKQWIKWVFSPNEPPKIDYSFQVSGEQDYIGVGFDYPEEKIKSIEWIGNGPYRVWKNRLEGVKFGVHSKEYNNTVTGESWDYPEFKGYHADCHAATIKTSEGNITIIPTALNAYFQILRIQAPKHAGKRYTVPPFPSTNIGLMHAIPPIGTKFQNPELLGPSGQKNMQLNYSPIKGSIYLIL